MKKQIYYLSFTLFGALFGFFVHMILELWFIKMLMIDFDKYSLGLSWAQWEMIHNYGTLALVLGLGYLGFRGGKKWWRILYVEKRYLKRWGVNLKENF